MDADQLMLLLQGDKAKKPDVSEADVSALEAEIKRGEAEIPAARCEERKRKAVRIPEHLPVIERIEIDPEEVRWTPTSGAASAKLPSRRSQARSNCRGKLINLVFVAHLSLEEMHANSRLGKAKEPPLSPALDGMWKAFGTAAGVFPLLGVGEALKLLTPASGHD